MEIRTYNPTTDYPDLEALLKDEQTYGGNFDPARDAPDRVAQKPESIFVAVENEVVIGTVTAFEDGRSAWLYRFAVKDENEAVLRGLYKAAKEYFKEKGHTQFEVYGPVGDEKFIKRYESLGFTKGNDYTAFWRDV